MADSLFVTVAPGLKTQIDDDPVAAPQGVVELLDPDPGGAIDFEIDHHLFAPKGPPFVEHSVGEETTPFARMAVGGDKLK